MAGRVAESIIFGKENVTNGAQQDFRQASQTALQMVFVYGMSDLGALAIPSLDQRDMWTSLSDDLKNKASDAMDKIMKKAEEETFQFLTKEKDLLHRLALHLIKVRTVDGEIIDEVLSGKWDEEVLSTDFPQSSKSIEQGETVVMASQSVSVENIKSKE
jgi:ATP-dependent Zn protease